ncbi:MAG: pyridoxal phosphate-dependent decarboxylase family protein [Acidimicrobiales bacterium]
MAERIESRIVGRAVDYLLHPPTGADPVIEFLSPGELVAAFSRSIGLPLADRVEAHSIDDVTAAVDLIIRHSVHTSHPRFLNQNFAGPDPVSVVGDWLGAALNTTGATFEAAPVFTLMESAVLDKLARLAGYPVDHGLAGPVDRAADGGAGSVPTVPPGLFCPGGSTATLYALQLARHRHQPDIVTRGAGADRLVLFVSEAGHYAATKSAALLGLGTEAVVKVETDCDGAMVAAALELEIERARSDGRVPLAVIGTAGTTVTSAFDDLNALADVCEANDLWLHVDGCYGGSALFSDSHAHLLDGVDRSDSLVWNLHKMMGMTQQCTALLVRDPSRLAPCFAASADYLFQPDKQHGEYDSGDRTFQCARRIDVLKLWLTWKVRGDRGFSDRIDHAVAMADHARSVIAASDGVFAPVVAGTFSNVVFTWVPPELRPLDLGPGNISTVAADVLAELHRLPPLIKARMQQAGTAMVGFQPVGGINTFRLIFMNPAVTSADVEAVLARIDQYGTDAWNDRAGAESAGQS